MDNDFEDFFEDETHVCNCLEKSRAKIKEVINQINTENEDENFFIREAAYTGDMIILPGYFAVHINTRIEGQIRDFYKRIG